MGSMTHATYTAAVYWRPAGAQRAGSVQPLTKGLAMHTADTLSRRRQFLSGAALALATAPFAGLLATQARAATAGGATGFAPLKTVDAGDLRVAYAEAGPADGPVPAVYARKFSGRYQHRQLDGGIGHNLPQEAPAAFAQAVIDVTRL